ncbi:MAG TPA: ABC transporter permease [Thermoclostridium caenicola]|uniref:ABC transporter permease n=1 Tax=Thermoclostridium caenicola TaxID=659425 RepID=UPI002C321066|nr:ABC transporter permease [Thermoclostridium caenicola]HOK42728.1 ABC transporter permease [Thermoclostridium caenicola]HOL84986.1 ABC transporter permease [Thermoclostridium caenicola]HPO77137.1 ABC transporter permease [Thermoclostridium caenicola]
MLAILRRDFRSYFNSPIAYVLIGLFICIMSLFFVDSLNAGVANFSSNFISSMSFMLLFIVPILTMRSFSEDKKSGTEVLLLTSPVRLSQVVLGKYLAATAVFLVLTAVSLIFPLVLLIYGKPDGATLFSAYLGFILLGMVFISVGVFASSLTENQIVAAIITFVSLFTLTSFSYIGSYVGGLVGKVLNWLAFMEKYYEFSAGIIDITSIIFMLSFAVVFVFLTVRILERKRWSQG